MSGSALVHAEESNGVQAQASWVRNSRLRLIIIFLLGAAIRTIDVSCPIIQPIWRECDVAGIARNFAREGMDILHPRVDWRGTGPGFAEMEFPLQSWIVAVGYRMFGEHEFFDRLLSSLVSIIALYVFIRLTTDLLDPIEALFASLFFAISPLAVRMATAIQPEPMMLLGMLVAVRHFLRWTAERRWSDYWIAMAATAFAILCKAPAASLGILFALVLLKERGLSALRDVRVWLFAAGAVAPPLAWYVHARNLWLTYGNSLGVSNEHHWIGLDFLTRPEFAFGILRQEARYVWGPFGIALAVLAVWTAPRARGVHLSVLWLVSTTAFYIAAARTTSSDWAFYYHIQSLPPAAMLIGVACGGLFGAAVVRPGLTCIVCVSAGLVIGYISSFEWLEGAKGVVLAAGAPLVLTGGLLFGIAILYSRWEPLRRVRAALPATPSAAFAIIFIATVVAGAYTWEAGRVAFSFWKSRTPPEIYGDVLAVRSKLTVPGLILACGSASRTPEGFPVAYNASYCFYWLDRKGFNIPADKETVDEVAAFQRQGVKYFVAENDSIRKAAPEFESQLRKKYPVIAENGEITVFQLDEAGPVDRVAGTNRTPAD